MIGLTLYDVLAIPTTASTDDVRKAYKLKALETHPDKLEPTVSEQERRAAEGRFRNVCDAFEVLSDPIKRKAYDNRIHLAQKNKKVWDEKHDRRVMERDQWARQTKERSEARMKERADFYESLKRIKEEKERYMEMVERFYQELRECHPEWESRRQAVLQRKEMADKGQIPRRHTTRI
ncbi:DnaJ domain-containing protein [Suillus paluster]|uniref:DnaJ domain-containing protein n=1 Tax=Suillus paluster TaxID=48578 RepID=UPI001B883532|nr:DnaJ domain-containing protein [Suillus paluster]KAG1746725.1 DnaJ domain-containing protein [Suillus paluster]